MKGILLGLVVLAVIAGAGAWSSATAAVYACIPATGQGTPAAAAVHIYNAQIATANVTAKLLSANGTNLNAGLGVTTTFTIAAGNTRIIRWTPPTCTGLCWDPAQGTNASTIPVIMRIVSDQLIAPSITWDFNGDHAIPCNLVNE